MNPTWTRSLAPGTRCHATAVIAPKKLRRVMLMGHIISLMSQGEQDRSQEAGVGGWRSRVKRAALSIIAALAFAVAGWLSPRLANWLRTPDDREDFPVLEVALSFASVGNAPPYAYGALLRRAVATDVVTVGSDEGHVELALVAREVGAGAERDGAQLL